MDEIDSIYKLLGENYVSWNPDDHIDLCDLLITSRSTLIIDQLYKQRDVLQLKIKNVLSILGHIEKLLSEGESIFDYLSSERYHYLGKQERLQQELDLVELKIKVYNDRHGVNK